jgi:hypothetical protein
MVPQQPKRSMTPEQRAARSVVMKRYWAEHPEKIKAMAARRLGDRRPPENEKELRAKRLAAFAHGIYVLELHWMHLAQMAMNHRVSGRTKAMGWALDYEAAENQYAGIN